MTVITVKISNEVVDTFGVQEIERQINDLLAKIALKVAAKEMLQELKNIDLSEDPMWKQASNAAWEKEKKNVLRKINRQLDDRLRLTRA